MENYNETSGNGNRQNDQDNKQRLNRDQNLSNQENQSQSGNMFHQDGQTKKPVYIKDMPEIKPEVNQGGI